MKNLGQSVLLTRTRTHSIHMGTNINQHRKMVTDMQSMYRQQKQKRQKAQQQLLQYRKRVLRTQRQFTRILQKYDDHIANLNGKQSFSHEMFSQIINTIEQFNSNSQQLLEDKCNQLVGMMGRRVNQILQKTDIQIKKTKKLSEQEYREIKREVKQVLKLAEGVDAQNGSLKKQNQQIKFKFSVLRQERDLLVQELAQKKILLIKMAKTLKEQRKETGLNLSRSSKVSNKNQSLSTKMNKSILPKFMCQPSLKQSFKDSPTIDNPEFAFKDVFKSNKNNLVLSRTDAHLKTCLQRQKKKNSQLKGIVAKLQQKVKDASAGIQRGMKATEQASETQKLKVCVKLIQDTKMRLMVSGMVEPWNVISVDLKSLLQTSFD